MDFISIDGVEYTKLKNKSIKYEFLIKYLMNKLYYNYITECVSFDYKLNDDLINILIALDPQFDLKIRYMEEEANIKQEGDKDEDTN